MALQQLFILLLDFLDGSHKLIQPMGVHCLHIAPLGIARRANFFTKGSLAYHDFKQSLQPKMALQHLFILLLDFLDGSRKLIQPMEVQLCPHSAAWYCTLGNFLYQGITRVP